MIRPRLGARGQGLAVDLLAAVLVFLLIGGSIAWIWTNKARESRELIFDFEMQQKAERTLDALLRGSGYPSDWEEKSIISIQSIGLAKRDRVLDSRKVEAFIALSQSDTQPNLIAYYKLDEDSGENVSDSSGTGNAGLKKPQDAEPKWVGGYMGNCLEIFAISDHHVLVDPVTDFPSSQISVSFWMKSSDKQGAGTPISYALQGNNPGDGDEFAIVNYNSFQLVVKGVALDIIDTDLKPLKGITAPPDTLEWRHLVFTWRSDDGKVTAYLDGKHEYVGQIAQGEEISPGGRLVIGRKQKDDLTFEQNNDFDGLIDEIAIFNKVLAEDEVKDIYDKGIGITSYEEVKKKLSLGGYEFYFRLYDPEVDPGDSDPLIETASGKPIEVGKDPVGEQVTIRRPVVFSYQRSTDEEPKEHEAIAEFTLFTGSSLVIERTQKCDDGVKQYPEECDKDDFGWETCETVDPERPLGNLVCNNKCEFDLRGCKSRGCGLNNIVEPPGEECESGVPLGKNCADFPEYNVGELSCNYDTCQFDKTDCAKCDDSCDDNPSNCPHEKCIGDPNCNSGGCCGDGFCNTETESCYHCQLSGTCSGCLNDCGECCGNGELDPGELCDGGKGIGSNMRCDMGYTSKERCNAAYIYDCPAAIEKRGKYYISQDIGPGGDPKTYTKGVEPEGTVARLRENGSCISINNVQETTLDCQGHSIIGEATSPFEEPMENGGEGTGISISRSRYITLKECSVYSYSTGIDIYSSDRIEIEGNLTACCNTFDIRCFQGYVRGINLIHADSYSGCNLEELLSCDEECPIGPPVPNGGSRD